MKILQIHWYFLMQKGWQCVYYLLVSRQFVRGQNCLLFCTCYAKPALQVKHPAHKLKCSSSKPSWWMCNDFYHLAVQLWHPRSCRTINTLLQHTAIITIAMQTCFDLWALWHPYVLFTNDSFVQLKKVKHFLSGSISVALFTLSYLFVFWFESHLLSKCLDL